MQGLGPHCWRGSATLICGRRPPADVYRHLGDAPVAVLAVDVGLSIDQHAVGQFEHQDLRIVQSPTGQVVAEFEPARLVNVPRPVADPEHSKDLEFDLVVLIDPDPF